MHTMGLWVFFFPTPQQAAVLVPEVVATPKLVVTPDGTRDVMVVVLAPPSTSFAFGCRRAFPVQCLNIAIFANRATCVEG